MELQQYYQGYTYFWNNLQVILHKIQTLNRN
jgi:hypothetical protein